MLKTLSFQLCNYKCQLKYVKVNQCRQSALDVVVETDVDYKSNDAYTTYQLLSSVFFPPLFTKI